MSIQIVFFNDDETDVELVLDRDYEEGHVMVIIDNYGDRRQITVPVDEFQRMVDLAGFRS